MGTKYDYQLRYPIDIITLQECANQDALHVNHAAILWVDKMADFFWSSPCNLDIQ